MKKAVWLGCVLAMVVSSSALAANLGTFRAIDIWESTQRFTIRHLAGLFGEPQVASLEVYPAVGGKLSREYAIFESNVFWKSSERPQNVALILSSSHDYTDIKLLVTAVGRTPEETSSLNHSLKTAIEYKLLGLRDGLPGTITGAGRVQLRDVALVPGGVDPRSEGTVSRLQRLGLSTRPSPVVEVSMEFMVESQARAISRQVQEVLDTLFNEGQAGLDRMTADWVM